METIVKGKEALAIFRYNFPKSLIELVQAVKILKSSFKPMFPLNLFWVAEQEIYTQSTINTDDSDKSSLCGFISNYHDFKDIEISAVKTEYSFNHMSLRTVRKFNHGCKKPNYIKRLSVFVEKQGIKNQLTIETVKSYSLAVDEQQGELEKETWMNSMKLSDDQIAELIRTFFTLKAKEICLEDIYDCLDDKLVSFKAQVIEEFVFYADRVNEIFFEKPDLEWQIKYSDWLGYNQWSTGRERELMIARANTTNRFKQHAMLFNSINDLIIYFHSAKQTDENKAFYILIKQLHTVYSPMKKATDQKIGK